MHNLKQSITQRLMPLLPESLQDPIDKAMLTWWSNLRATGGLRLTLKGYAVFVTLEIESWSVPVDWKNVTKKHLLELDRKVAWPYYIEKKKKELVLFSSREAMMATLYGDITQWLAHCESRGSVGTSDQS